MRHREHRKVLWVIRDCLSGRVLLARPLLSATQADLAGLLREVIAALPVPGAGVVSDGQHSIRRAVAGALPGVPRTNNDLEHPFGSHRHHERRATGRRVASPSLVLRGSVHIVAATATRIAPFTARDLATDHTRWLKLRRALETRRQARASCMRFRRNLQTCPADHERRACRQGLPT
ncbi:hypothetical protein J2848_005047 [Azospirillum lipoferum]|nr:hypothetical protein [Azospirillum lipoferum]